MTNLNHSSAAAPLHGPSVNNNSIPKVTMSPGVKMQFSTGTVLVSTVQIGQPVSVNVGPKPIKTEKNVKFLNVNSNGDYIVTFEDLVTCTITSSSISNDDTAHNLVLVGEVAV